MRVEGEPFVLGHRSRSHKRYKDGNKDLAFFFFPKGRVSDGSKIGDNRKEGVTSFRVLGLKR